MLGAISLAHGDGYVLACWPEAVVSGIAVPQPLSGQTCPEAYGRTACFETVKPSVPVETM